MPIHNFNAGPAVLPAPVLRQVQQELVEHPDLGYSVMEMSHRSREFDFHLDRAENGLRQLLGLGDDFAVLFLGGGASLQFSMAPLNLLVDGARADYLINGSWGVKALHEAQKVGAARLAASTEAAQFRRVPSPGEMSLDASAKYVHFTSNETIEGVQWPHEPETAGVLLACDASSDILSRPLDISKYGLIYAGAQKNIGPSGVTVVIIRRDWVQKRPDLGTMLSYATHLKDRSLYNTPNTFGIYMIGLVCEWISGLGGLQAMQKRAEAKAGAIYEVIDSGDFYRGHAEKPNRSQMNVTFRLPSEELDAKFASEAQKAGMIGLKGHRSVGGLRASIYNALEPSSVRVLTDFMREFERKNG
ncbi:MAG TPA: 3-phosphoserine/phosphohydroxythreonine transaminase [Abditibacterium sp.]|jgi:phosphoserine aminotransferase